MQKEITKATTKSPVNKKQEKQHYKKFGGWGGP